MTAGDGSPAATTDAGSIYDLGYRRYDGPRLGRRHAIRALFRESLRGAFGLGRSASAKVGPAILVAFALVPALIQLAIAALVPVEVEIISAHDYYGGIKFVLALYVAVVAPDIVGRDQRNRSLTLYFTRAITRTDYALGKLAAMTTAMLVITLVPQLVLFIGNALAARDFGAYVSDEWTEVAPIVGTAVLASWLLASIGSAIAAQTPQRAFATVGIIVAFLLPLTVAATVVQEIDGPWANLIVFLSPLDLVDGVTYWMFQIDLSGGLPDGTGAQAGVPQTDSVVALAGYALSWFALATVALGVTCSALLVRRYRTVQA